MSDEHAADPRSMVPSGPVTPRRLSSVKAVAGPAKSTFKMKLSQNSNFIGYFGVDSWGYAKLAPSADNAVIFNPYSYGLEMYYRNHANGMWLSVNESDYAAFYNEWSGAEPCGYNKETRKLICCDGHHALSFFSTSDGYLYFWEGYGYTVLQVDFEVVAPP